MACYEAVRDMPVSPIRSPRPDQGSLDLGLNAPSRYEALPGDETEANPYSEPAIDPLPPSISMPISPKPRTWSQHLYDRIGYSGLLVLVLGSAVIFISSAILIFLWTEAEDARNRRRQPKFWNDIVFRDWSTRVVTICSATIRISLAFQIGFITSAMSAVMLEASRCRFRDIATLSIQRASSTNASPSNVLPAALRQCIASGFSGFCYFLILSTSFAIALVSIFTSTTLLSDFGTARITAPRITEIIPLGINHTLYDRFEEMEIGVSSYFKSRPSAHWRFAEAKTSQASSIKLGDTGDVYRALLPFSSPEVRASLEYYSGPGLVNNHRTVCVGPKLEEISLNHTENREWIPGFCLEGTLSVELQNSGFGPVKMGCPVQGIGYGDTDWPLSTCELVDSASTLDIYSEHTGDKLSGLKYLFYPIVLINGSTSRLTFFEPEYRPNSLLHNITTATEGPWTKVYVNGTRALSATICFVNTSPVPIFNITMSGRPISSEPIVDWRRFRSRENNPGLLQQLSIGQLADDFTSREILELQIQPSIIPVEDMDSNDIWALSQHESLLTSALSEKSLSQSRSF